MRNVALDALDFVGKEDAPEKKETYGAVITSSRITSGTLSKSAKKETEAKNTVSNDDGYEEIMNTLEDEDDLPF